MDGQSILENLAVAARGFAEPAWRDPGGAMEGAHEVGEIAESDIIGDHGDRAVIAGQAPRRVAQP